MLTFCFSLASSLFCPTEHQLCASTFKDTLLIPYLAVECILRTASQDAITCSPLPIFSSRHVTIPDGVEEPAAALCFCCAPLRQVPTQDINMKCHHKDVVVLWFCFYFVILVTFYDVWGCFLSVFSDVLCFYYGFRYQIRVIRHYRNIAHWS